MARLRIRATHFFSINGGSSFLAYRRDLQVNGRYDSYRTVRVVPARCA